MTTMIKRLQVVAMGIVSIGSSTAAIAAVFGSLANFDVVNDTGQKAYGFEIEIDDPGFDHTKLTSVFGYDRNFGLPAGPGAVVRYGVPGITDLPGVGVLIKYGGTIGPVFTPSAPYNTPGDSCWPFGAGWSTATSCDHYGVSTLGQPSSTKYRWLVESAPGSGVLIAQQAGIPAVNFAYTPPAVPAGPAALNAQVDAVAPNHEQPENEGLWGEPFWVKTFTTPVDHNIDLGNLFREDKDQQKAEVETEWALFQKAPVGEVGGNDKNEHDLALGANDEAVIRRYEFYNYLGPVKADGEANCNGTCEKDPHGLDPLNPHADYVGVFVGQQIAGFNVADNQGPIPFAVPEPGTYALIVAGLAMVGVVVHRRRPS
jgi:hypothetical protein